MRKTALPVAWEGVEAQSSAPDPIGNFAVPVQVHTQINTDSCTHLIFAIYRSDYEI
jgi:hypothetical protein